VIVTVVGEPAPVHSSVATVTAGEVSPPKAKADVCVPAPAKEILLYLNLQEISCPSLEPSYSSVAPVTLPGIEYHQKLMLQFEYLHLLKYFLLYLNFLLDEAQVVPSYSSVAPVAEP
jgi:hypothetical protein